MLVKIYEVFMTKQRINIFETLNIVEIYFDWAGPCHAMTRYIKKIKMELGEERDLKFIQANADLVPALHPFRGSCKVSLK